MVQSVSTSVYFSEPQSTTSVAAPAVELPLPAEPLAPAIPGAPPEPAPAAAGAPPLPAREIADAPPPPPALELVPAFESSGADVPEHALK